MKVENKNAHRAADKEYFFATHVRDGDGGGDDVVMLLLTDKELERASKRAEKNKEDLPKHFAIIQGKNEDETILLDRGSLIDDTDAAQPKKSGGFFSWLMGD
jgi:hypothetical protein